jgi:hypothetical protein
VKPGEEGRQRFQKQLMHITGSKSMEHMQAMFQCRAPGTQDELEFKSMEAFDAVMHYASISAAARASAHEERVKIAVEEQPTSSAGRPLSLDHGTRSQAQECFGGLGVHPPQKVRPFFLSFGQRASLFFCPF